jgi:hypothetical protein
LHYLAKRVRGDILTAVSFCATPTEEEEQKLKKILSYLRIGDGLELKTYVDASFGLHVDGKSVTGVAISPGGPIIYIKSGKHKIVTRSST